MLACGKTYDGSPHGLAIVEADGSVTVVEGRYDNFVRSCHLPTSPTCSREETTIVTLDSVERPRIAEYRRGFF
jgi:hypothetical protein